MESNDDNHKYILSKTVKEAGDVDVFEDIAGVSRKE